MKAYITCPASHTKKRLKLLPIIGKIVEDQGIEPFIFRIGGEPEDIFKRDYGVLKSSDILIAEVSERSHGVGVEIGLSYGLGLKRILLIEQSNFISKFVKGIPETVVIEYTSKNDLKKKLKKELEKLV